jgi:hypothetical protein
MQTLAALLIAGTMAITTAGDARAEQEDAGGASASQTEAPVEDATPTAETQAEAPIDSEAALMEEGIAPESALTADERQGSRDDRRVR